MHALLAQLASVQGHPPANAERAVEELRRKAAPLVPDVELDPTVIRVREQLDGAVAVAERVVDEVRERLLEPEPVAADAKAAGRPPPDGRAPGESACHGAE